MPTSTSEAEAAFAAAFPERPLSPAMLEDDGRKTATIPHADREQATRGAEALERLEAARIGLGRVQQLVGRLRDVTVVALDRRLQPADRAMLQRQVDLMLTEIDTVADATIVDERLLQRWASTGSSIEAQLTPFRELSTGTLGIAWLAVRSSDQALAASGALEVATARLERSASTLSSATARLQDMLDEVASPTTAVPTSRRSGATQRR